MRTTVRKVKSECTGCGACVSICPKKAISMQPDEEGFLYPAVDGALCVECDLCEKRCPVGNAVPAQKQAVFGVQHLDKQIRSASSSGGVFTALARGMLARGGVVFGAAFDENLRVEHIGAFDENEIAAMRGSKYVQSDAADAIENAASLLSRGIPVLFSGTPCQIAGLKAKAGGRYDELLLTVDFVCHGVPSPGVFASYLAELEKKNGKKVVSYTFRDKRKGWRDFCAIARFEDGSEHVGDQRTEPFLYGFLQNLYLRPSCPQCTAYRGEHHLSDLTIADLWGAPQICSEQDDNTGLSLVFANTARGAHALDQCGAEIRCFSAETTDVMRRENPSIWSPAKDHTNRSAFFARYKKRGFEGERVMKLLSGPGLPERVITRIAHLPYGAMRRLRALFGGK